MKTLKTLLLAILLTTFSAAVTSAQNYKAPAIDFSGTIKDTTGHSLGKVSKEGIITNPKGKKVAHINSSGLLVDEAGKIMGKPSKNGNFSTTDDQLEFTVRPSTNDQCEVLDKDGKVVVVVHNNYKAQAGAIAHCMKMNMLK